MPYMNPNYYSPYQYQQFQPMYQTIPQNQTSYMDRMAQSQNMQQPPLQPTEIGINGRIVDDFSAITANDVPMDGNGAIFIKKDGSEIQVRNWTAQGTIVTNRFKPILEEQASNSTMNSEKAHMGLSDDVTAAFMGRFDDIAERIERLEKSMTYPMTKSSNSRTKKEVDSE